MINTITLVGRLVADPELRTTANGVPVATFRVAVDRRYAQNGERQADFIPCVAWRNTAEFVSHYFTKGKSIGVQGSLQSRNYEDNQGNKRTAYEVNVDSVSFVGAKEKADAPPLTTAPDIPDIPDGFREITPDEDMPF